MSPRPPAKTPSRRRAPRAVEDASPSVYDFQTNSLGYALRCAQVRAYELYFQMLGELELTPARATALSLISMDAGITQATLAKRLDIAGPSAVKVVDALEAAGLVRRDDVDGDRRRYSLMVTEDGFARLAQMQAALDLYEARLAQGLSPAERRQLLDLLGRIAL